MRKETTSFASVLEDWNILLTGEERYPIMGHAVPKKKIIQILESYQGLTRYWDCIRKAQRAQQIIGEGDILGGSMEVMGADMRSSYGFLWNPPLELHAWVQLDDVTIFDAALPGVIQRGLITKDAIGPAITGRVPVILAGKAPQWIIYRPKVKLV